LEKPGKLANRGREGSTLLESVSFSLPLLLLVLTVERLVKKGVGTVRTLPNPFRSATRFVIAVWDPHCELGAFRALALPDRRGALSLSL
jgi:hypothetical protein